MGGLEKSIEIRAPPEKVWEMLALDRWSEWQVVGGLGSLQIEKGVEFISELNTPGDKYRVGAAARPTTYDKLTFKVTESLENEKITYLVEEPGRNSSITLVLEPVEDGTNLTYAMSYKMPWGVFGKFLEKAFAMRMGEGQLEKSLEKLKSIMENRFPNEDNKC
ncbi:MAG: SRPBCC family protein [Candidatus Bathyarchaeota archaeon]|nr:SRPBCC family protein [Candidatus Bathyarchaeota archaeon]